jgi:epoxide hydrolase-like predicted phosphatase
MTHIKGIIFDCFGVLLADVLRVKAEEISHIDPEKGEAFMSYLRAGDRGILGPEEVAAQVGTILDMSADEVLEMSKQGEVKNELLLARIPELREHYKVAMLSNINGRAWLDDRFGTGVLDGLFDVVVASGDVGMIKPEPAIFEFTAERLGLDPSECVMIDDLERYCEGARAVGMQAIQFHSTKQVLAELQTLLEKAA